MVSLSALLSEAWDGDRLPLAAVPFVVALASFDKVLRIADAAPGVSLTVSFPHAVTSLWAFLNVPASGGGVNVSVTGLALLPVVVALTAVLGAGYLGRIEARLRGTDRSFADGVGAFVVPLLGYELLRIGVVGALLPLAFVSPLLIVVLVPLVLVVSYLFYPTPFLVVTEDRGLVAALRRSYDLTTGGGAYLSYAIQYALVVLGLSIPASLLARNVGIPGVVMAALLLAPAGLALDGATMLFVMRNVGSASASNDGPAPAVRRLDDPQAWDGRDG